MNQLDWLGEVPKRWRVVKLRQILRPFSEKNHPDLPLLSVVREKGVIVRNVADKEENHNYVPEDLSGYKRVKRGQFAMNKMKAWQGSYGVSKYDGIVSPAYYVFDIDYDINHDFFNAAIRSKAYVSYFGQASDGIRVGQWDLSMQRMKEIPFLVPPHDEQEQIVCFLDWKVSAINRLINLRRKEITALEDLKRSIIHHAVTHGIKPNVPMKDSGVQWIGKIPEHWKVFPMYAIAHQKKICNCTELPLLSVYLDLGVIPFSQKEEKRTNTTSIDLSKYQRVDVGDFVLNNQQAWRGSVGVSFDIGIVSPAYIVLSMNGKLTDCFANYLLRSRIMVNQYLVNSRGVGSIQRNLYWASLKRSYIPVPPMEEQLQIVDYIENWKETADRVIQGLHGQIENLQDLKARLISDVVTGKIDVRGVEVPEYETVEEETGEEETVLAEEEANEQA